MKLVWCLVAASSAAASVLPICGSFGRAGLRKPCAPAIHVREERVMGSTTSQMPQAVGVGGESIEVGHEEEQAKTRYSTPKYPARSLQRRGDDPPPKEPNPTLESLTQRDWQLREELNRVKTNLRTWQKALDSLEETAKDRPKYQKKVDTYESQRVQIELDLANIRAEKKQAEIAAVPGSDTAEKRRVQPANYQRDRRQRIKEQIETGEISGTKRTEIELENKLHNARSQRGRYKQKIRFSGKETPKDLANVAGWKLKLNEWDEKVKDLTAELTEIRGGAPITKGRRKIFTPDQAHQNQIASSRAVRERKKALKSMREKQYLKIEQLRLIANHRVRDNNRKLAKGDGTPKDVKQWKDRLAEEKKLVDNYTKTMELIKKAMKAEEQGRGGSNEPASEIQPGAPEPADGPQPGQVEASRQHTDPANEIQPTAPKPVDPPQRKRAEGSRKRTKPEPSDRNAFSMIPQLPSMQLPSGESLGKQIGTWAHDSGTGIGNQIKGARPLLSGSMSRFQLPKTLPTYHGPVVL
ncbi:MAG: hypothetical protein M1823_000771 [Watsoniomyces obsoletus]|nr:MAG: hypothetical protein M1823_000771 [Watsoniomyces obsoletus]